MSNGGEYGGGENTTTSTTLAPFNPDDAIPTEFDRNCPPSQPCSSVLPSQDLSGPDEVHFSGISHLNATFTSKTPDGHTYTANGRRAYRIKTWSTFIKKRGWIYFDSKSACWRFTPKGTETTPPSNEFDCIEYFDTDNNSIGCKIAGIRIDETNRICSLEGIYLKPSCDSSSSPVGDWYCPVASLLEQESDPILTCETGARPYSSYQSVGGSLQLTSAASCIGSYKINGDENGECVLTYLEPTPTEATDAKIRTVLIKINDNGTCTWGANLPTPSVLAVGQSRDFIVINGKNTFRCKFTYLEIGSAIAQMSNTEGTVNVEGTIGSEEKTIGGSFTCDTNRIYPKERYICEEGDGVSLAEGFIGSTHQPFSYALFKNATITKNEGFEYVDVNYEGVIEDEFIRLSVNTTTTTEPIDTHENFCEFGGFKGEEENGAIFNDDGTFKKFELQIEGERNPFAGVKSYLYPSVEITEVVEYSDIKWDDLDKVGKVCKPRKDSVTKLDAGQKLGEAGTSAPSKFLCVGAKWQAFGTGCIVTLTYRLSGENGWDKDIYERE
tara:strand:- start:1283 stop:2941 length:1659 start_codon:yes stop_codon:yes gene_type:complete